MIKWFRKRKAARQQFLKDVASSAEAPRLHGVNLVDWAYLGRTTVAYTNDLGKDEATVFSFCLREDTDKRKFVVIPHNKYGDFDRHTWVMEHAALWKIGERELWATVSHEPSRWLKDYMLENHDDVWCDETSWWIKNGSTPTPKKKKANLKLVTDPEPESNVVTLDFGKSKKPKKEE